MKRISSPIDEDPRPTKTRAILCDEIQVRTVPEVQIQNAQSAMVLFEKGRTEMEEHPKSRLFCEGVDSETEGLSFSNRVNLARQGAYGYCQGGGPRRKHDFQNWYIPISNSHLITRRVSLSPQNRIPKGYAFAR